MTFAQQLGYRTGLARGIARNTRAADTALLRIGTDIVSAAAACARLGIPRNRLKSRIRHLRQRGIAITWESLT